MNVENENEKNDSSDDSNNGDDDPDSLSGDCRRDDDNDSNDNGSINGRDGRDGNSRPVDAEVDLDDDGAASSSEMAHFRASQVRRLCSFHCFLTRPPFVDARTRPCYFNPMLSSKHSGYLSLLLRPQTSRVCSSPASSLSSRTGLTR
jgi:hypothetical protein